ncbi:MAG: phosphatidylglycerol lysyltransferase domain-containing protein [Dehalococcoidales bacterium]|nr:phosphatidylglycerol lysyltransferase domain-containing protein [Dehalococcoidales bacterium]
MTFTNLFIWRSHYGVRWSLYRDWLLFIFGSGNGLHALPPVGPSSRQEVTLTLLRWLREQGAGDARIERADKRLIDELADIDLFQVEPSREHFDYVYRSQNLVNLAGRKYHAKRNYINTFRKTNEFSYEDFTTAHVPACLDMAERWCRMRRCEEDMSLEAESIAVREAVENFNALKIQGGVIKLNESVEAFALGEMLNPKTAVVHIEKADPDIRGLYAIINQQVCEHNWQDVEFINREQDLGEANLREAKLSYQPDHMVEKFRIRLK